MTTQKLGLYGLFCLSLFLFACSSDKKSNNEAEEKDANTITLTTENEDGTTTTEEIDPQNVEEAMNQVKDALSGLNKDGKAVEVVNFRDLKEALPKKIAGMDRTSHSGEKTGMFGINVSQAQAEYEGGDKSIDVSLIDFAGVSMFTMQMAAWSTIDIDKESDNGYERTTTIEGHKAFEKYDSKAKSGEVNILVADRFILNIKGRNVSASEMKDAVKDMDLKAIAKLK
ncbi:MAG TPA: hypothetical protein PKA00_05820 [Saprospiraceae bacterium]|mgnify:CR=1 FL=1|nr:hypothetical protein [Saprospiraceae bacterium]HMQ82400.1 hypothetical protein [Saprospiraceae bacterium]